MNDEIRKHLELLFKNLTGYIYILTLAGQGSSNQQFFKTIEEATNYIENHLDKDIYVCVASMKEIGSGKKENCFLLPCFFVDIDRKNFKSQEDFNKAKDYLFTTLPPNFVVHSGGGGFHAYYKLLEPLAVQQNREDIETILKTLAKRFKGDSSSANVNRLLRVAGTTNYKYAHKPKASVEILNDTFYTIEHFYQAHMDETVHYEESEIEIRGVKELDYSETNNCACIKGLLKDYFDIERVNRNQATMHLATFFKDRKIPLLEAQQTILNWAIKIPKHLTSTHNPHKLKSSTFSCVKSVYEGSYHFSCAISKAYRLSCSDKCELAKKEIKTKDVKLTQGEILTRICEENIEEFVQGQFGDFYVVIPAEDHRELWSTSSKGFRERWLARLYREQYSAPPSTEALKQAKIQVEGICEKQKRRELYNRVAWHEGNLYYDLSNEKWQGVKVAKEGWEIVELPMVFRRYKHQVAQVEPVKNGNPKALFDFCNVKEEDRCLFLATVASWFIPDIPHPVMLFTGEQGSGKSNNCRTLKSLIDPSTVPFIAKPKDIEAAQQVFDHHWFLPLDNISGIRDWLSDFFCRAVTGEGTTKRSLYTDDEDFIRSYRRCVAINGIGVTAWRPDLLDRSIIFETPLLKAVKSEQEITQKFKEALPYILGGFLTAISKALNHIDETGPNEFRMADFARWGKALAKPLGFNEDEFTNAYRKAIEQKWQDAAETSILGEEIIKLVKRTTGDWQGTARELFETVVDENTSKLMPENVRKNPQALSRELRRLAPALRQMGIKVNFDRKSKSRLIILGRL
jgi:energy-coupling factor transporter ATP-binding protein EcfA2